MQVLLALNTMCHWMPHVYLPNGMNNNAMEKLTSARTIYPNNTRTLININTLIQNRWHTAVKRRALL